MHPTLLGDIHIDEWLLLAGLAAGALIVGVVACDDAAPETCRHVCTSPDPGPDACALRLTMDEGCEPYFDAAEVAVNACLEPAPLVPGQSLVSCARPALGEEFTWTARSKDWQWGPWRDTCIVGGRTLDYHVSCR